MRPVYTVQDLIHAMCKVWILKKLLVVYSWTYSTGVCVVQILSQDGVDEVTVTRLIHRHHSEHPEFSIRPQSDPAVCYINIESAGATLHLNGSHGVQLQISGTNVELRWSVTCRACRQDDEGDSKSRTIKQFLTLILNGTPGCSELSSHPMRRIDCALTLT
jgi:hypothetical protein